MKMVPENNLKAVFPVAEVATEVGLSRARFWQLYKMGVFPEPLRSGSNCRFYSEELRQKCIEIRKTGIGYNGQPTVFYDSRKDMSQNLLIYEHFVDALQQMKKNVTLDAVKKAIHTLYPDGLPPKYDEGCVVGELYRYFDKGGCKNAV